MDKDFLKDVFKEVNAHIRATEQKSLVLTGAFVGFYLNGFVNVLRGYGVAQSDATSPLIVLLFHLVLLFVGSVVYTMQLWYRAWKEHYIQTCVELRKTFVPDGAADAGLRIGYERPWLQSSDFRSIT